MKKLITIFLSIIIFTSVHSQVLHFGEGGISFSSGFFEIPLIVDDKLEDVTGLKLGFRISGDGYDYVSSNFLIDFVMNETIHDPKHISFGGFSYNPTSTLTNGDTLALFKFRKHKFSDLCIVLKSPIIQTTNMLYFDANSPIDSIEFKLSTINYCTYDTLSYAVSRFINNVCHEDKIAEIAININQGVQPYQIIWTSSNGDTVAINKTSISNLENDIYYVSVTDDIGFHFLDTFHVTSSPEIVFSSEVLDSICPSIDNGYIKIQGDSTYMYEWNNGSMSAEATKLSSGNYSVIVIDTAGCEAYDSFSIYRYVQPQYTVTDASCTVCDDAVLKIFDEHKKYIESINIVDKSGNKAEIDYLTPGFYDLTINYHANCVVEQEVYIPFNTDNIEVFKSLSVITPNTDDANSRLVFDGLEIFPNNKLRIFNKWGNIVYSQEHYQQAGVEIFSGEYHGKPLPEGQYYYILEINEFRDPLKSSLTILR